MKGTMESELLETIRALEKLNEQLKALNNDELNEAKNNVQDFTHHKAKLRELVGIIKTKCSERKLPEEELVYLMVTYSTLVWHFEQMEELINKMVCALPDEKSPNTSIKE